MTKLLFEELMPGYYIKGDATIYLHEAPFMSTNAIIQTDQPFHVHFKWEQGGWLSKFFDGNFECRLFFEKMGGGEETFSPSVKVKFVQEDPHVYTAMIPIPANTLGEGIYRVVASVLFFNKDGKPAPIAAFGDLGMIQMYTY